MTWQPFGPDDKIASFTTIGSHYRGFAAIPICDTCKTAVETGTPGVIFTHKRIGYIALNGEIKETPF